MRIPLSRFLIEQQRESKTLDPNLRLLIEGEEEIGSPNLERYMDAFPEAFAADVMILTDCENPSPTQPGLTVSLRGLLEVELRCAALEADGHANQALANAGMNSAKPGKPETFDAFFKQELTQWTKVVKDAGIKLE